MGRPKVPNSFVGNKVAFVYLFCVCCYICVIFQCTVCGKTVDGQKSQYWHTSFFHGEAIKCSEKGCDWVSEVFDETDYSYYEDYEDYDDYDD